LAPGRASNLYSGMTALRPPSAQTPRQEKTLIPARICSSGITTRSVIKTLLIAFPLSIVLSIAALAQDSPNPSSQNHRTEGTRVTSILGTVRAGGHKLTFVTDRRAWNVDNPKTLEGHEGHFIRVKAQLYPDKDWIHITEVKPPTAIESRNNDGR